jgi:hypothetical protein
MGTGGLQRWRLANSLRSAYAAGLLTQDTFAHRIDHLYGGSLVHPEQLVGDLSFRGGPARPTLRGRFAELTSSWQPRLEVEQPPLPLLPLDWSGSTTHLLIGRGSWCDLVIAGDTVSRRHAELFFREGGWVLVDQHSTNGTYINGARVHRTQLLPGDGLAFGREQLLVD